MANVVGTNTSLYFISSGHSRQAKNDIHRLLY